LRLFAVYISSLGRHTRTALVRLYLSVSWAFLLTADGEGATRS